MIDIFEVDEVCIYSYTEILAFKFMLLGNWTIWQYPLTCISITNACLEWKLSLLIHLSQQDPDINETDITSIHCGRLAQMTRSDDLSTFGRPFRTTRYA